MNDPTHPISAEQLEPYITAMDYYRLATDAIGQQLQGGQHRTSIPGYIASGDEKHAFMIETESGQVVAKFLHNNGVTLILRSDLDGTPEDTTTRIIENAAPLIAGHGCEGTEQLLALDIEQGIMVTTYAPGKRMPEINLWQLWLIKRKHLRTLSRTLASMRERNLHFHNAGGILFDPKTGFSMVDYEFADTVKYNKGSMDSTEEFLRYALRDFRKYDALERKRLSGLPVPEAAFRTTGLRGWVQNRVIKRVRHLRLV